MTTVDEQADIVIKDGYVMTMDAKHSLAEAIAIKNGVIIYVGENNEVEKYIGGDTLVIDAEGKTVLPGLIDSHIHLIALGITLNYIDLRYAKSIEEIKKLVRDEVRVRGNGEWIIGRGWDQENLVEKRCPTKYDLDEVAPSNPVLLIRVCGHVAVANSMALNKANISKTTQDPPGGIIERDSEGNPTGVLKENAVEIIREIIPKPTTTDYVEAAKRAIQRCLENGITTVHMMSALPEEVDALWRLYKSDELKLRIRIYLDHKHFTKLPKVLIEELKNDWVKINGIKIMIDGSLGGRTAALRKPYADDSTNKGTLIIDSVKLKEIIRDAVEKGMQLAMHGIGDRAIETILNVLEEINREIDVSVLRMRIEHGSIMPPDLIERAKRLNTIISVQPSFIEADFWILDRVGEERIQYVYNYKTLLKSGLIVCSGSDAPVSSVDTLRDFYLAVTRGGEENTLAKYTPQEALTIEESVTIYTYNGAYAGFDENKIGSIEPGKYADIVILDRNIRSPHDLKKATVWITLVNGEIIYKSKPY